MDENVLILWLSTAVDANLKVDTLYQIHKRQQGAT